ncbi:MAG: carboxypeptidase regulatory-like domain-containing protein [Gammaproteobacteria bacterium]|nr:carboxypeptidase regulatory-like domain-containing protein [Gammaproteobacteria bacterium]
MSGTARAGAICGTVSDADTGALLADVTIAVFDNQARVVTRATTDTNGHYHTYIALDSGVYYTKTTRSYG